MRFAAFFFLIFIYMIYIISKSGHGFILILLWPATSMLVMGFAYMLNKPSLVLGKNRDGKIKLSLLLVNLPWLLFSWLIFRLQVLVGKENFSDPIKGTNLWLSRRPLSKDNLDRFDLVIDLTCEFPRDGKAKGYVCYPNLDGHFLTRLPDKDQADAILIHCANGHGRSSVFAAILLYQTGRVESIKEALSLIRQNRKRAQPNSLQKKWLLHYEASLTSC